MWDAIKEHWTYYLWVLIKMTGLLHVNSYSLIPKQRIVIHLIASLWMVSNGYKRDEIWENMWICLVKSGVMIKFLLLVNLIN